MTKSIFSSACRFWGELELVEGGSWARKFRSKHATVNAKAHRLIPIMRCCYECDTRIQKEFSTWSGISINSLPLNSIRGIRVMNAMLLLATVAKCNSMACVWRKMRFLVCVKIKAVDLKCSLLSASKWGKIKEGGEKVIREISHFVFAKGSMHRLMLFLFSLAAGGFFVRRNFPLFQISCQI